MGRRNVRQLSALSVWMASEIGSAGSGRSYEHGATEEPVGYAGEKEEEDVSLKPRRVLDQR